MQRSSASETMKQHWREYLMEASGLGVFMLSACIFVTLIEHPGFPVMHAVDDPYLRRLLIGIAMGSTAIAIIYSPWGKQSGAHLNPAVTLTFYRLGKIAQWDAVFYVLAQFCGAIAGVGFSALLLGRPVLSDPSVHYVATAPGDWGVWAAFIAELAISFGMMITVLTFSNRLALNRYTGLAAGALVALYVTFEAPLSGMSMNPARTFGSALAANDWTAMWLYFAAPLAGMFAAAEVYVRFRGASAVFCCKLHHDNDRPCIFNCRYTEAGGAGLSQNIRASGANPRPEGRVSERGWRPAPTCSEQPGGAQAADSARSGGLEAATSGGARAAGDRASMPPYGDRHG
jgi:aquaporin Z